MNRPLLLATVLSLGFAGVCAAEIDRGFLSAQAYPDVADIPFPDGEVCGAVRRAARPLYDDLVLGEPLIVQVRLEGAGLSKEKADVSVTSRLGASSSIRLQATPSDPRNGGTVEIAPYKSEGMGAGRGFKLGYGEVVSMPVVCAHDPNSRSGAAFDAPDTYIIQIGMNCISKNPITGDHMDGIGRFPITVSAPEGDDKIAWELLRPYTVYKAIQDQMADTPQHRAILEELVAKAPKARVRPIAIMALANSAIADSGVDPKQLAKGEALLTTLLRDHPDHFLAAEAARSLIRVKAAKGEDAAAREIFVSHLWSDPRGARLLPPGNPLAVQFAGPTPEPIAGQWMVYVRPRDGAAPASSPEADIMRAALGDDLADMLGEPVGFRYE